MNNNIYSVTKVFNSSSYLWRYDRKFNECTVKNSLDYCYALLEMKGYLFLNKVYWKLGLPLTKEGQTSGWVYDDIDKIDNLWTIWHKNDDEFDVHITFEMIGNILNVLPSEEEL